MKAFDGHKLFPFLLTFATLMPCGCDTDKKKMDHGENIDTLKVVTLYGPTSIFDYRGEYLGVDYENVRRFAKDGGMELEIEIVSNIGELIEMLESGKAHLGAYPVPDITEYNGDIIHCGPAQVTYQVLVQRKSDNPITDVTELIGKEVVVGKDSKYEYRLHNLNDETGGGITVTPLANDTISEEDFLDMVKNGDIDYTVVDSETAGLNLADYPELDFSLHVSLDQAASWVVAPGLDSLASQVDRWEQKNHNSDVVKEIYKRYYERGKSGLPAIELSYFKNKNLKTTKTVSPYDALFRKYADTSGYDWKLLAAIAYCESRYQPDVVSRFGATGLMQVMPSSAGGVGMGDVSLLNPDNNVATASKMIAKLDKTLQNLIEDPDERMKFVIAAYNSGLGHIYDSMALAEKQGLDNQKWLGNVSVAVLMKSRPEFYRDPVVKHGYFRGRETVEFVDRVMSIYNFLSEELE
ncbi:MAG: transglycosylase SLT domain-containing protein [Muribaculaceae bacterium]|nr:transglycosylase SLT domain-containing protein [Muribaculaceae bacterium]